MARAGLVELYAGEEPVLIRTMGGSIPIAPFVEALAIPAAIVPSVNIDNNQHSPNENLVLGSFYDGLARLMAVLAETPPPPQSPSSGRFCVTCFTFRAGSGAYTHF